MTSIDPFTDSCPPLYTLLSSILLSATSIHCTEEEEVEEEEAVRAADLPPAALVVMSQP